MSRTYLQGSNAYTTDDVFYCERYGCGQFDDVTFSASDDVEYDDGIPCCPECGWAMEKRPMGGYVDEARWERRQLYGGAY